MLIHVVKPGDTVYSIALEYGIPMSQLILDNGLETSSRLAVGQALVVQFPTQTHTVQPGETLASIAAAYQLPLQQSHTRRYPGDLSWPDPGARLRQHAGGHPLRQRLRLSLYRPGAAPIHRPLSHLSDPLYLWLYP